ncbi:Panacea domain-containing protein [uncultured Tessaracoccus sp.]|uniref:Panacea domain-containing protein n=1 Tax=uncultured Tessaracoccus sp. TaxID=905023 RepID=UPI00262DC386|nr:Panacea domain-containing protein [uncultured Tessaracoccus sp.]
MTRALDVLKHINETSLRLGEVQRQKLLYYVQGWSLAWDGVPMFKDRIEAWKMGPVVPTVCHCGSVRDPSTLSPTQKATIDAVVKHYR